MITILVQICQKNNNHRLIPIAIIAGLVFDIFFAYTLVNSIRGII